MTNNTPTPLQPAERFSSLLEDLFDLPKHTPHWMPAVDIKDTDTEYRFHVEVPGMNKEDLEIEIVGDLLVIKGKREDFNEQKTDQYVRRERKFGRFQRSFKLEYPVDAEQVIAEYAKGVLTVVVPKAKKVEAQRIPVR